MGYRSDVRSLIYGDPDSTQAFWTKHVLANNAMIKDHPELIDRYSFHNGQERICVIDLTVESWKWYEVYEHVEAWNDMLTDAEETFKLCYEFVRVGEEEGDIEHQRSAEQLNYLYSHTQIVADLPIREEEPTNEKD